MPYVRIDNVRCGYPTLAKPKSVAGGAPRYGISVYLPPDHPGLRQISAAIQEVISGDNKLAQLQQAGRLEMPNFKMDPKTAQADPSLQDHICVRAYAREQSPPYVADENNQQMMNPNRIQGGDYVDIYISVYAYYDKPGTGLAFGLEGVKFVREGAHFSSRPSPEQMFGPPAGAPPATAPGVPGMGAPVPGQTAGGNAAPGAPGVPGAAPGTVPPGPPSQAPASPGQPGQPGQSEVPWE